MGKKALFKPHSNKKQKEYQRLARLEYGPDNVNESIRRWNGYSKAQKEQIGEEGNEVYRDVVKALKAELSPDSDEVQDILRRWHQHLRYFYEPTTELLRGLGDLYNDHPDFNANFKKIHPELAEYMRAGINEYVDQLETNMLMRMLAEDEAAKSE